MGDLVIFTSGFPYGSSETFLETEIEYLAKSFDKLTIVVTEVVNKSEVRKVPANCELIHLTLDYSLKTQLKSLLSSLDRIFWKELFRIKKIYQSKITLQHIKIALLSLQRAKVVKNFIAHYSIKREDKLLFYSYWCMDTAIGIALARQKNNNIRGVSRIHGWDVYFDVHQSNYLPYRELVVKKINKIASISERGIKAIKEQWKVEVTNVTLYRLGTYSQQRIDFDGKDVIKIASCSNLIPLKRVHLIVETLKKIEKNVEWTHFGDGVLMDGIKENVQNLPSNIKVDLKGRIPNKEIFEVYQEIKPHLFINVSSSEGIPVSIMEAMSFGIPCIATNVGGNSEIVNNENGFLLSENPTIEQIKLAIFEVHENHCQKSENAYNTWKEQYNAEKNYSHFCELLENIR
jgi:glycosyltransferase involved in cell wall biosynthesis